MVGMVPLPGLRVPMSSESRLKIFNDGGYKFFWQGSDVESRCRRSDGGGADQVRANRSQATGFRAGLRADYRGRATDAEEVADPMHHGGQYGLDDVRRDLVGHDSAHHCAVERVEPCLAASVLGCFLGIV
jgi:hypothetical protein